MKNHDSKTKYPDSRSNINSRNWWFKGRKSKSYLKCSPGPQPSLAPKCPPFAPLCAPLPTVVVAAPQAAHKGLLGLVSQGMRGRCAFPLCLAGFCCSQHGRLARHNSLSWVRSEEQCSRGLGWSKHLPPLMLTGSKRERRPPPPKMEICIHY